MLVWRRFLSATPSEFSPQKNCDLNPERNIKNRSIRGQKRIFARDLKRRFRKIAHSEHLSELLVNYGPMPMSKMTTFVTNLRKEVRGGPIFVRYNIGKQNGSSDGPNVGLGEAVEGLSPAGPLG